VTVAPSPTTPTAPAAERSRAAELDRAVAVLRAAGVPSPEADAQVLAAAALGVPRAHLPLVASLPADAVGRLRAWVDERARRVPLQYLVGAPFRHLMLAVGPGVFVPRPETEVVAGWAIDWARARAAAVPGEPVRCADLCTGSGAIALALATEVPAAVVDALELEESALGWARRNRDALDPEPARRVRLHQADISDISGLSNISDSSDLFTISDIRAGQPDAPRELRGRLDLVVANPPYLPEAGPDRLEPEVAQHDPPRALWGGPDGLAGPRAVAELARVLLRPGGALVIEHDDSHGASLPALLAAAGVWKDIQDHPDLAGRDRFVTATLAGTPGPVGEREENSDD